MRKRTFALLPLLAFLLVACSSPADPVETAIPPQTLVTDAATPLPTQVATNEPRPPINRLTSECTLVSSLPDTPPAYAQLFALQESDWTKGPADAAVTIIEYSDFQ
ncbi:MAG: hypothetical protein JW862_19300 [Anaerolineales bacterium]|nr:hypothetical protein [Anaerolineales bacterium]